MATGQEEIREAIKIVKERGLILPGRHGGRTLDGRVVGEVFLNAVDGAGQVDPFILAFARQIIANSD